MTRRDPAGVGGRSSRYVTEDSDGTRRRRELEIDELEIQKGLLQISKALEFLHENAGLVHGNLTPDAILINSKASTSPRFISPMVTVYLTLSSPTGRSAVSRSAARQRTRASRLLSSPSASQRSSRWIRGCLAPFSSTLTTRLLTSSWIIISPPPRTCSPWGSSA